MTDEFGVPVRWVETRSRNTAENAVFSRAMLAGAGIDAIVLVTHAAHMPRAVAVFEQVGFRVTPAPTGFANRASRGVSVLGWLPDATSLARSTAVLREHLGQLWYRMRY